MSDYRTYLQQKGVERTPLVRTEKRPGDVEFVYRNGRYIAYKHEARS